MTRWLLLAFRKQNLLITTHILLLLWLNGAVLLMSSFSQSSSRLFFNQSSYISPFVPTAVFVLKRKTQSLVYSDSLVTCPCPSSFSRGLIHLHERQQGISDSYCGSVDRFSALWAWVCCVCDCVWETEGGGGAVGLWWWWGCLGGGDTRGISVSLVETARKQQTGFTLKVRAARRGVLIEFTMNAKLFHRQCFKKHEIHLKLHCTCPALPLNTWNVLFAINNSYPVKVIH